VPDRMLVHNEQIVHEYLQWAMCGTPRPKGTFKLYAVEGGTAAMCYTFKSLKANRLLNPGDTIALGVPIFTPYLEMPHLEDFGLNYITVQAPQENRFQYTDQELAKLLDPKIKASSSSIRAIRTRWRSPGDDREDRRDPEEAAGPDPAHRRRLRDVRAGIPLAAGCLPAQHHRRLLVQQVLRLHGLAARRHCRARGQRVRRLIAKHPEPVQKLLDKRYGTLTLEPRKIKFIDRIVADSRDVALNHTAGLSLPQQVMMSLFSLYELMDEKKDYQKASIGIVKKRFWATVEGLGIELNENPLYDFYYGLIDFEFWLNKYHEQGSGRVGQEERAPLDIVFRLAADHGIVLLNGSGFEAPDWSARISFANLDDHVYDDIGRAVRAIARGYVRAYEASKGASAQVGELRGTAGCPGRRRAAILMGAARR
jgi:aspartate 4-decarboxylase